MAQISVSPTEFTMVDFSHEEIVAAIAELAEAFRIEDSETIEVVIDEASPLTRMRTESVEPMRFQVEGGAFEDTRRPRQMSADRLRDSMGRLLLRAVDRRSSDFGDPPPDDELSLAHSVAWEIYTVGRLAKLGSKGQRKRRLYQFRNRHGFTDRADAAFDELWNGSGLTWAQIVEISDRARGEVAAATE